MRKVIFLIAVMLIFTTGLVFAEEIRLTTIIPGGGGTTRAKYLAIGNTYSNTSTYPDSTIFTTSPDVDLLVEGNVGIGTTAPDAKLTVTSTGAGTAGLVVHGQSSDTWFPYTNGQNYIRGTTIIADLGGNVGIGTPSPQAKLHVGGVSGVDGIMFPDNTLQRTAAVAGSCLWSWGSSSSIYNGNSGNVGIGTSSPGGKLEVDYLSGQSGILSLGPSGNTHIPHTDGNVYISGNNIYFRNSSNAIKMTIVGSGSTLGTVGIGTTTPGAGWALDVSGIIHASTTCFWSDIRLKKNIETLPADTLNKVSNLRGVKFDWRREEFKDKNFSEGRQIGVIAQEVEKEFPELVTTDNKGYKSVAYDRLTAVLLEAVKELKKENDSLEKRISVLESKIAK